MLSLPLHCVLSTSSGMTPGGLWQSPYSLLYSPLYSYVNLIVYSPQSFTVYQRRSTCYELNELNGTHHLLHTELFAQLDSAAGVFAAVSELGRFLALRQSAVDTACKHIFDLDQGFTLQRRVQPKVNVSPSKKGRLQHHNLLAGHVSDFSTGHIQVRCHPGIPTAGVLSTNLIHNGDWTFQILVMLEMTLQQGDIYTCQVEHPSLDGPVTVEWSEGTSDSAWSKMLAGVGGFVLGLIALLVSFILHFRSQ
uniref:Major histocompatibility complex, class II, DP beta 1 n=2 Tax=Canis lupus familiaris TaxID=9615 RepID=A0A8P0TPL2_CANLF